MVNKIENRNEFFNLFKSNLENLDELAQFVLIDDKEDIGKFDRIHHWHIGYLGMLLTKILKEYYSNKKEFEDYMVKKYGRHPYKKGIDGN